MKKIDAINILLSLVGSSPVNSVDSGQPDAVAANNQLDRATTELLSRGWWFNTDYAKVVEPDPATKQVSVGSNALSVQSRWAPYLVQRGKLMYNPTGHTYQFEEPLTLDIVTLLDWDLIPTAAQEAIRYRAGYAMVLDELEDAQKASQQAREYEIAVALLKAEELRARQYNTFNNPRILRARAGVRPYYRGLGGAYLGAGYGPGQTIE